MIIEYNFMAPATIPRIKAQILACFAKKQVVSQFAANKAYSWTNRLGVRYFLTFKEEIILIRLPEDNSDHYAVCSAVSLDEAEGFNYYSLLGIVRLSAEKGLYGYIDRRANDPLIIKMNTHQSSSYKVVETIKPWLFDLPVLKNLSANQSSLLADFFQRHTDTQFFSSDVVYSFKPSTNRASQPIIFLLFSHNVIKYKTNKHHEIRYGVYFDDHLIGKGGNGQVYLLTGTLRDFSNKTKTAMAFKSREHHKPLAVKVFVDSKNNDKADINNVIRERELSAKNLKVKDAIFGVNMLPHLLLKYFPYPDLMAIMQEADEPLSISDKLVIVLSALTELKKHIHSKGMAHLDIKPDNMIYNEAKKKIIYIDYGLAKRIEENGIVGGGTTYYSPPEAYDGRELTPASDLYSLGIVIALLFQCFSVNQKIDNFLANNKQWKPLRICELARNNSKLPRKCALLLQALIINLTAINPEERLSLDEAIDISTTLCNYFEQYKNKEYELPDPQIREFIARNIDPTYGIKARCREFLNKLEGSVSQCDQKRLDHWRAVVTQSTEKLAHHFPLNKLACMSFKGPKLTEEEELFTHYSNLLEEALDSLKSMDDHYAQCDNPQLDCTF